MTSIFPNVLSSEELQYLNNLPEVLAAKASLDSRQSGMVYFSVAVTESIRATLQSRFGLDVKGSIPMRWIKGDTTPHVDTGASAFENTYLLYLSDSPGDFVIDSQSYPIEANTGFVFSEGLSHKTQCTAGVPRLLLGPMNELAEPVGVSPGIKYYLNKFDADNNQSVVATSASYEVGDADLGPTPPTSWKISVFSSGLSPSNAVYNNGDTLNSSFSANYFLYPYVPSVTCFLEGSTILCQIDGVDRYIPVERLTKGTMVKTSLDGYKSIVLVGKGPIQNPGNDERTENRLYKCSPSKYPQLKDDLYITGCHSILESKITDIQKEASIKHLGRLFVTDHKYRLMACVDERAEPWNSEGAYTIWHFALEHHDDGMNYGVYANGGLLVETCSIRHLKNKSNMTLIE